jgi:organic radical activating enzyme
MITYPVHERFQTFQGEGAHLGKPAFFIRLFGCPLHCEYCDAAGTWHPDWVPDNIPRITPAGLVTEVLQSKIKMVVITGGEPAVHQLAPLVDACAEAGLATHLETSGAFPIRGNLNWITLSPKRARAPLEETVEIAHEFKVIVEKPEDIPFFYELLTNLDALPGSPIWLHPEWSQRQNPHVLNAITKAVIEGKGNFRAGWQLHKLYKADTLDPRSQQPVPLGGNPAKGF